MKTSSWLHLRAFAPRVLPALLSLGICARAEAVFEVGNGGDGVFCDVSVARETSLVPGWNLVDVVVAYGGYGLARTPEMEDRPTDFVFAALAAVPQLHIDYSTFFLAASLPSPSLAPSPKRIWREAKFGLHDIKDELLVERLPAACGERGGDAARAPKFHQIVIRETRPGLVFYNYDATMRTAVMKTSALNASYLLVHEWLWDYVSDARVNRDINMFLHHPDTARLAPSVIAESLRARGLRWGNAGPHAPMPTPTPTPTPAPTP